MPVPHLFLQLSAYADGRLPTWRRALLERHLVRCTRCALEVAQIRAVRGHLGASAGPETPPGLPDRLLRIGQEPASEPPAQQPEPEPPTQEPEPEAGRRPEAGREPGRELHDPGARRPAARPLAGAVGVMTACLLVLGAAGAGALVTGMTTPAPGTPPRASFTTVLPRLLAWPADPGGAATVRPVDNGDRP